MKMYFTDGIGTPALTSWRLTPMPQSITKGVSFTTTRLAGFEAPTPIRGPPLVPRNTIRVRGFAVCANPGEVANAAALLSASFSALRRSIMEFSRACWASPVSLAPAKHAVEHRQADDDPRRDSASLIPAAAIARTRKPR